MMKHLVPYRETLSLLNLEARKHPGRIEFVSLTHCVGRILGEDIASAEDLPPFANSEMDGFAIVAADTRNAASTTPQKFKVLQCIAAGQYIENMPSHHPFAALEIMTGAPLPPGPWDAVVRYEDVIIQKDAYGTTIGFTLTQTVSPGKHVRRRGADISKGERIIPRGTRLDSQHILSLAALGITNVPVMRQPRIAIISTGNELVDHRTAPGQLPHGKIRNSTTPYLLAELQQWGAEVVYVVHVRDQQEQFCIRLNDALKHHPDIILSTGAVSAGKFDFVAAALKEFGGEIFFHRAAIKPGKPILFAKVHPHLSTVFFGMPGNPVSTAVGLRFFVWPYVRQLCGLGPETPKRARLGNNITKPEGLFCFYKANYALDQQHIMALPGQASFKVQPLNQANSWLLLHEHESQLHQGSMVEWLPFHPWHFADQLEPTAIAMHRAAGWL